MNKEEFFYRPKTAKEIVEGKRSIIYTDKNIAEKVLGLSANEALVIPALVPDNFESRMRFLKRAPQVILDVGESQFDAIKNYNTPLKARIKACSNLKKDEKYCGMVWKSLRKNEHKRVRLDDSIDGEMLFAWTQLSGGKMEAKAYNAVRNVGYYGGKFKITVPSRTPKHERYEITLESVPIMKSKFNPVIWTDITANHYCGITGNDFSYRYVSSEDFCAHVIAAYIELAKQNRYDRNNSIPLEFIPFPLVTEELVKNRNKIIWQVVVEYKADGKKKLRPANKADREILLWQIVNILGHDNTLYATKKFVDYEWLPKAA